MITYYFLNKHKEVLTPEELDFLGIFTNFNIDYLLKLTENNVYRVKHKDMSNSVVMKYTEENVLIKVHNRFVDYKNTTRMSRTLNSMFLNTTVKTIDECIGSMEYLKIYLYIP